MIKDDLITLIKENSVIKEYKRLEEIVNNDSKLLKEVEELKDLQKQLVNLNHIGKEKMAALIENKYNKMLERINKNPIIHNYLELQDEINELLREITTIIEKGLKIPTKY